jgi:hypothetical protein
VTSESGKVKVFAGRRSDPFFFNFGGTKKAIHITENLCAGEDGTGTTEGECPPPAAANATDAAGCFKEAAVGSARADFLRTVIKTKPSTTVIPGTTCGSADADCFLQFNVMAIVVQIDKTELNQGSNHLVSVWASSHTGS